MLKVKHVLLNSRRRHIALGKANSAFIPSQLLGSWQLMNLRCLFWVSRAWVEAEAIIKNVSLKDPLKDGLDRYGEDKDGHLRVSQVQFTISLSDACWQLNSSCCPICDKEKYIVKHSHDVEEQKLLMKQLERILCTVS